MDKSLIEELAYSAQGTGMIRNRLFGNNYSYMMYIDQLIERYTELTQQTGEMFDLESLKLKAATTVHPLDYFLKLEIDRLDKKILKGWEPSEKPSVRSERSYNRGIAEKVFRFVKNQRDFTMPYSRLSVDSAILGDLD